MSHQNDDSKVDAALRTWHVPPPSPWLKTRITQRLLSEAKALHEPVWPMAPLKLLAASIAVAVVGVTLGLAAPKEQSVAFEDTAAEMDMAMDTVIGDVAQLDGADMIDAMW
jgi:hypothetical protein